MVVLGEFSSGHRHLHHFYSTSTDWSWLRKFPDANSFWPSNEASKCSLMWQLCYEKISFAVLVPVGQVLLEGLVDKVEVGEDVGLVLVLFKHVRPPEGRWLAGSSSEELKSNFLTFSHFRPWWWSSGQSARLLLRRSEFDSRWSLQFFCKIVVEKN